MMLAVKERIMGAVTVMSEEDANKFWRILQQNYGYGLESVEPTKDEIEALDAYESGDPEYQATISQEDAMKLLFD